MNISIAYRVILISAFILSVFVFYDGHVYGESCIGCHTNPRYKKEDIQELKECLACHGSAGHPYKEVKSVRGVAEAADKPVSPHSSRNIDPDIKDMILIPEGEFLMGTDNRLKDERPVYVVYINAFYIDRFEVTNVEYKEFVDATGHPPPDHWENGQIPVGKEDHPVVFVTWYDADVYCKWIGKRLPRETEWEKAARGTDGRIYPWGNEWDLEKSNNPLRGHEDTMPIGSFEEGKSPYGLYDMSGNVWEWVDDYYLPHPGSNYESPEFGTKHRMLKGGSWWDCMFYGCGISAPTYNRAFFDANTKNDSSGIRCVVEAK